MRKPANIVLTLVGAAVAGGTVVKTFRPSHSSSYGYNSPTWRSPEQALADREYANDEYVEGSGYYHAPFHAWYPMRFDTHDPAQGYYRGGQWLNERDTSGITRSMPTAIALATARAAYLKLHPRPASGGSYGSRSSFAPGTSYYGGHGSTTYHSSGWDGGNSSHGGSISSKTGGSTSSTGISHGGFGSHGSSGSHGGGGSSSS